MLARLSTAVSRSAAARRPIGRVAVAAMSSSASPRLAPASQPLTEEQRAARRAAREQRRREKDGGERLPALGIEGSVRHYERHYVVVETRLSADAWPKKLEMTPQHVVGQYVGAIAQALGGDIRKSPLVVTAGMPYTGACQSAVGGEKVEADASEAKHDILVFPDNLRVFDVEASQSESLGWFGSICEV